MGHQGVIHMTLVTAAAAAALTIFAAGGCAAHNKKPQADTRPTVAPWGAGAATETDLSLCMADASAVHYHGTLKDFLVMSSKGGGYLTWALTPAGPYVGCEVDVRACADDAEALREQHVLVFGRLLQRDKRHLPLLVADQIIPMPADEPAPPEPHTIVTTPRMDDSEYLLAARTRRP